MASSPTVGAPSEQAMVGGDLSTAGEPQADNEGGRRFLKGNESAALLCPAPK
jgi:hypothetical protein